MEEEIRRYPIGIQTFRNIVEGNYVYVDKTRYIVDFLKRGLKFIFLSRPRRFGKSLFASTLHAYYAGRKELFKGLAIADYEKEWVRHPVLHFDMSGAKHMDKERLGRYLDDILADHEALFGYKSEKEDANIRLKDLVVKAYEKTGRKVVVIIDEYDAPLLDVVHIEENLSELRQTMRNFYSPLKLCEPYLRFVFLTGITKFSQLSIFSELNNIKNISMDVPYSGICGITKDEMLTQMSDDIDELADKLKLTREQTIGKLKENYDGYHFSYSGPDVFNPFSLLNCFADGKTNAYWFGSGTPTYLIEMMRKFDVKPTDIGPMYARASAFDAPTENMDTLTPLLYQSGYITIKDYDPDTELYLLDLPNKEIKVGLFETLLPSYLGGKYAEAGDVTIARMSALIRRDDIDGALRLLQTFLHTVPYCNNTDYEGHYQQVLFIIFTLLTHFLVDVEVHTPKGRVDIVMLTHTRLYILELKLNKDAATAMRQISLNDYASRFALSGKPVTKVGINFSVENKMMDIDWLVE